MEQQIGSKLEKYFKAVCCQPTYLTYMQSTLFEMLGCIKHKLESRLPEEISITSDYADDTALVAESEEELKSLLMKVKEEWKNWLKAQHSKNKIMASSPITSWQIDVETVADFIFLGSKITTDGDCSMKLKDAYYFEGKLWLA